MNTDIALAALRLCVEQLCRDGVPAAKNDSKRIAVDKAQEAIAALEKACGMQGETSHADIPELARRYASVRTSLRGRLSYEFDAQGIASFADRLVQHCPLHVTHALMPAAEVVKAEWGGPDIALLTDWASIPVGTRLYAVPEISPQSLPYAWVRHEPALAADDFLNYHDGPERPEGEGWIDLYARAQPQEGDR